jgi:hypothetical protein
VRENQFPALHADVEAEPLSWGDVLGAHDEEQAAQREYEALVWSVIATQVPLDWEVMNPLLMRRKAAHEAFRRVYRLWERSRTRRNGTEHLVGNAAAPLILPPSGPGLPRPTLCPAPRDSGKAPRHSTGPVEWAH